MVLRLFFFAIITQRGHKYATHSPAKQFYVFLATAPTDVLTAGTAEIQKKKIMGKVSHIYGKTKALHHCGNYCTEERRLSTKKITGQNQYSNWAIVHIMVLRLQGSQDSRDSETPDTLREHDVTHWQKTVNCWDIARFMWIDHLFIPAMLCQQRCVRNVFCENYRTCLVTPLS